MSASGNSLTAITQMAYWLEVGASYPQGCNGGTAFYSAQNIRNLSDDTIKKVVTIGSHGLENVIEYTVTLHAADHHTYTQFESLTGYICRFRSDLFTPLIRHLELLRPLSHTNGEQKLPVIFSTPDGSDAMGIYSPELPQSAYPSSGYGRFDFTSDGHPTTKWAVYRMGETIPGDYTVHDFVIVGSLQEVQTSMSKLYAALSDKISGTVTETPRPPAPVTQDSTGTLMPVYRFYSPGTGEHFYSLSSTEGAAAGMRPEGIGFHVYQQESPERVALYRCIYGKHFVSRDADCEGFRNEGRYGFVDSKASNQNVPLYRFFNPANGDHLITKSQSEGINSHYREEGILGYVSP